MNCEVDEGYCVLFSLFHMIACSQTYSHSFFLALSLIPPFFLYLTLTFLLLPIPSVFSCVLPDRGVSIWAVLILAFERRQMHSNLLFHFFHSWYCKSANLCYQRKNIRSSFYHFFWHFCFLLQVLCSIWQRHRYSNIIFLMSYKLMIKYC